MLKKSLCWLKCVVIVTHLMGFGDGAKILGLFPHASESHFVAMRTFMMELAKREHNVILYSSHRLDDHLDNITENIIEPEFPFWKEVQKQAGVKHLQDLSAISSDKLNKYLAAAGHLLMDYFLSNEKVQELLKTPPEKFDYDLIIADLFYTEALLAFGHRFNVPVIGVVNKDFANYMDQLQDMMVPAACLPYDLRNYDKNLGYWERLNNIKSCLERRESFINDHYGQQEKVLKKHFQQLKVLVPPIVDLQANMALLLVNNYYPLATAKPFIPNVIAAGGFHIRAPKELPWHIKRFLDEARFGAIYMHLGDEQNCADISKDKLDIIFHTLGKRQERVLWTCHDIQKMEGLPKNIMIQHLVPQTDIVAHPHIKLFIMNGDIMALQESIIRNVPLLGIPIFENEFKNVELAESLQIGVRIDYRNLTQKSLDWALGVVLHKDLYVLNIRDISKMFRDRPLGGLANALFWLDYILRYGSGPLRTQSHSIPLDQLHLSDLRTYYYFMSTIVCVLIGSSFLVMALWKKRQTAKVFSKLKL